MGPRIYPSYQDTNTTAKGSLIINFDGANFNGIDIYVNSNNVKNQFSRVDGLYTYLINPNDVVSFINPASWDINVIRRNYTTDDVLGNNGISDTQITSTTAIGSFTFTATTTNDSYNFEYRVSISNFAPTPTPTPTPCPTYTVIQSGLTFHVDFENVNSYSGGTKVYDLTSSDTGSLSGVTYLDFQYPNPCQKYMQLGDNNGFGNLTFATSSLDFLTGSVQFSMGGWVADSALRDDAYMYVFGSTDTRLRTDFFARPYFTIQNGPSSRRIISGTTQANYKTFNHIFGTNNGTTMKLYLNGQPLYSGNGASSIFLPTDYGFRSGEFFRGPGGSDGLPALNDVTIYNRELSDAEVLSNYNAKENSLTKPQLLSGITIQWEYNWSGGTAGNINIENIALDIDSGYYPLKTNIQSLGTVGGTISGSYVTNQGYLTGNTFNGSQIRFLIENCRNGSPSAQRTIPNNCSFYKNNTLLYTRNRTGAQTLLLCPTSVIVPNDWFIYEMDNTVNYSFNDGDVLKFVVNNYFIPDATPTPTPTVTPTPTATNTPTPTPTPIPPTGITLSGLTIYTDGSPSSYPGTGTTWTSIVSGTTYNGTLIGGPVWSGGTPPYFQFDGIDDFVSYPYSGSSTGSYTWGGWINIPTGFTAETLYMRGRDGSGSGWSLQLLKKDTNLLQASVVSSGFTTANAEGITYISTNTWYYVIGVWNPNSSIKLYLNGVLEKTTNTTITTLRSSNTGWIIARGNGTEYTQAKISNFALYERVLSDAEILSNFNNTKSNYGY